MNREGNAMAEKSREQVYRGKVRSRCNTLLPYIICTLLWAVPGECGGDGDNEGWDIRLANGDTPLDGTVQMMINGDWQTLCDKYITEQVAMVICRQLGFPPDSVRKNRRPVNSSYITCSGKERRLLSYCHWQVIHREPCAADDMQGIICKGTVRLDGGMTDTSGTLEVFHKNRWYALCDKQPDYKVARVVCRQLDYHLENPIMYTGNYYGNNKDVISGRYDCLGHEPNLENCTYTQLREKCDQDQNIGIECNGTAVSTSFAYGYSESLSGRININVLEEIGYWCALDPENITQTENVLNIAAVICYETGFSRYGADVVYYEFDGRDSVPFMDTRSILCTGRERRLADCVRRFDWGDTSCENNGAVEIGVQCQRAIHLVDGTASDNGRLELINDITGQLEILSDINADQSLAKVVCRQLDIESPSVATFHAMSVEDRPGPTNLTRRLLCSGDERLLQDCQTTLRPRAVKERLGLALGVTCRPSPRQVRAVPHSSIDGRGYLEVEEGGEWLTGCYPNRVPLGLDTNVIAMVLCHQLGFMRVPAMFMPYPSYTPADGRYGDLLLSTRCTGKEEHISNCSRQYDYTGTTETCTTTLGYSCVAAETLPVRVKPVKQEIECLEQECYNNCTDNRNAEKRTCSFEGRSGCMFQKSIDKVNHIEHMFAQCSGVGCHAEYTEDEYHYRYYDCCYSDRCNKATDRNFGRYRELARLVNGWVSSEGDVQIFHNNEWHYVMADRNVSTSEMSYICTSVGYHYSTVSRRPSRALYDGTCVSGLDFARCMGSPSHGSLGACGGVLQQCDGVILSIDCNVRRPEYRLVDGGAPHMGRVEVFYNGAWGTICGHARFDTSVANIICATLGFPFGASTTSQQFSEQLFRRGNGTIHFVDLHCDDWLELHETPPDNILLCQYLTQIPAQCDHSNDVGVICETMVNEMGTASTAVPIVTVDAISDRQLLTTEAPLEGNNSPGQAEPGGNFKDLTCYNGTCGRRSCSLISERCTGKSFCFRESRLSTKSNQVSIKYGCNSECEPGTKRKSLHIQTTRCCSQSLCNDPAILNNTLLPDVPVSPLSIGKSTPAALISAAMSTKSVSAHVGSAILAIIVLMIVIG